MTGNSAGGGSVDPGIYVQPQVTPAAPPPSTVYGQYGLRHFHGTVQNLNQVDKATSQPDRTADGPLLGPLLHLLNGTDEVDSKLSSTAKTLKQGLDLRSAPPAAGVV